MRKFREREPAVGAFGVVREVLDRLALVERAAALVALIANAGIAERVDATTFACPKRQSTVAARDTVDDFIAAGLPILVAKISTSTASAPREPMPRDRGPGLVVEQVEAAGLWGEPAEVGRSDEAQIDQMAADIALSADGAASLRSGQRAELKLTSPPQVGWLEDLTRECGFGKVMPGRETSVAA